MLLDNSDTYEITLTPIAGNPDLVVSINRSNTFPDKDNHDLISESTLATDSIIINPNELWKLKKDS